MKKSYTHYIMVFGQMCEVQPSFRALILANYINGKYKKRSNSTKGILMEFTKFKYTPFKLADKHWTSSATQVSIIVEGILKAGLTNGWRIIIQ